MMQFPRDLEAARLGTFFSQRSKHYLHQFWPLVFSFTTLENLASVFWNLRNKQGVETNCIPFNVIIWVQSQISCSGEQAWSRFGAQHESIVCCI